MFMQPREEVILVDEQDQPVGTEEKFETHRKGLLHRAISVFVFNRKGELMLQKRAKGKYHSGGLWSNTCCSHPRPGEETAAAASRRLQEEMGFTAKVREVFPLRYRVQFPNGLIENERDHIFIGEHEGAPVLNSEEAEDWKWVTSDALKKGIKERPEIYTHWLKLSLDDVLAGR
ncbi:MAG: isopentenyl-diphosphate Delta-isomerase [Patescibacteria group bacterium]